MSCGFICDSFRKMLDEPVFHAKIGTLDSPLKYLLAYSPQDRSVFHCKVFGRAVTGFSEKLFIFLLICEDLLKKRLENKNKCYCEKVRCCLLNLVGPFFVLSILSNLSIVFYLSHPRKNLLLYNTYSIYLFLKLKKLKDLKDEVFLFPKMSKHWTSISSLRMSVGMVAFGRLIKKTEFCFAILMACVIFAC